MGSVSGITRKISRNLKPLSRPFITYAPRWPEIIITLPAKGNKLSAIHPHTGRWTHTHTHAHLYSKWLLQNCILLPKRVNTFFGYFVKFLLRPNLNYCQINQINGNIRDFEPPIEMFGLLSVKIESQAKDTF